MAIPGTEKVPTYEGKVTSTGGPRWANQESPTQIPWFLSILLKKQHIFHDVFYADLPRCPLPCHRSGSDLVTERCLYHGRAFCDNSDLIVMRKFERAMEEHPLGMHVFSTMNAQVNACVGSLSGFTYLPQRTILQGSKFRTCACACFHPVHE